MEGTSSLPAYRREFDREGCMCAECRPGRAGSRRPAKAFAEGGRSCPISRSAKRCGQQLVYYLSVRTSAGRAGRR